MSNYENLIKKILDDANLKKTNMIDKAKEEAKKIIDNKVKEGNKNKELMINNAHKQGEQLRDKIISKSELNIKKKKLECKKQVLDEVFNEALTDLNNLSPKDLKDYITNIVNSLNLSGEYDLLIPHDYNKDDFSDINLKDIEISNIKPCEYLSGGFILDQNGTSINYSFDVVVKFIREEIEFEVSNLLFN